MDGETEGIRDHRGDGSESDEGESHDEDEWGNGSEDSSRGGNEDDEELGDEDPLDESDGSDDEEEDRLKDDDFEDKGDLDAFGNTDMTKDEYFNQVLPMKHNDDKLTEFYLGRLERMSNEAWARLGVFLGRNTHLRRIHITACNMTATSTALLFGRGPFNNNSIERLCLWNNPMIGSKGVTSLKPFFKKASSLTELQLRGINLGPEGIRLLSLELDGLPSLNILKMDRNNIGDEGLEEMSMLCFLKLTQLDLARNGIGRRGCEKLTDLLQSDESSLIELDLGWNAIDDACAEILAGSLTNNTNLEVLGLYNENISCGGWESFRRLVCDTSNMSATHGSNHTLREIRSEALWSESTEPILQQLERALADNGRPGTLQDKACRKIIDRHFEKGKSPGPLLDMDVKLMPRVFSWINQRSDEDFGDCCRNSLVFQILRTSNVCSFVRKDLAPPRSTVDVGGGGRGRENPGSFAREYNELGSAVDPPEKLSRLD